MSEGTRSEFFSNQFADEAPLLDRHWCDAGEHLALFVLGSGEIADHEDFWMTGNTQIRLHLHASGTIHWSSEFLPERGSGDSSCPQHDGRGKARVADMNRPRFNLRHCC